MIPFNHLNSGHQICAKYRNIKFYFFWFSSLPMKAWWIYFFRRAHDWSHPAYHQVTLGFKATDIFTNTDIFIDNICLPFCLKVWFIGKFQYFNFLWSFNIKKIFGKLLHWFSDEKVSANQLLWPEQSKPQHILWTTEWSALTKPGCFLFMTDNAGKGWFVDVFKWIHKLFTITTSLLYKNIKATSEELLTSIFT